MISIDAIVDVSADAPEHAGSRGRVVRLVWMPRGEMAAEVRVFWPASLPDPVRIATRHLSIVPPAVPSAVSWMPPVGWPGLGAGEVP